MSTIKKTKNGKFQLRVINKALLEKDFYSTFDSEEEARAYSDKLEYWLDRGIVPQNLLSSVKKNTQTSWLISRCIHEYTKTGEVANSEEKILETLRPLMTTVSTCELNYDWAEDFVKQLKFENNLSSNTINHRVGALKRCFDWVIRKHPDIIAVNVLAQLKRGYLIAMFGFVIIVSMRKRLIMANCLGAGLVLGVIVASVLLLANAVHIVVIFSLLIFIASLVVINLEASINNHKERLRIRNIFSGYVSPAILETILTGDLKNGLASKRKNIAFLFSDMRGFTAFSSTRTPEDVIAFLNEYYTAMTPVFHRYGGTVDKFSGDGVMVFFGAPQATDNPARDAIMAGCEMLQALEIFNEKIAKKGLPAVAIGVGIAYGEAIIGNVGSADRHDYAATGAVVNLAAHVQQYCKSAPFSLLIEESAFVHANFSQEKSNDFTFLGAVNLEKHGDTRLVGLRIKGVEDVQN